MTKIQWVQGPEGQRGVTWNPTTGCDRISEGCDHCYALTMAGRLKAMGQAKYQNDGNPVTSGPGFGVSEHWTTLDEPLRWKQPRTVFVNSMSDLFHARVSTGFVASVFATMARTPQHTYQILTKRPERMRRAVGDAFEAGSELLDATTDNETAVALYDALWPLENVWLGTSIESDRHTARADSLRETSSAVRFLSCEPLLGPLPLLDLTGIDWLIVGGESGKGARPIDLGWVREIRDLCADAKVPLFVKQLGTVWARRNGVAALKGDRPSEWPEDLRRREMPDQQPLAVA